MTADLAALTSWHAPGWRGTKVGVLGAAVVGFAAADTLVELGCDVLVVGERVTEERRTLISSTGLNSFLEWPLRGTRNRGS